MMGKHHSHLPFVLADLGLVLFVLCFFWGYVIPEDVRGLHLDMFRISVLGWSGMNIASFILGALQWTLWGFLIGWKVSWMKQFMWKKCPHGDMMNCCMPGGMEKKGPMEAKG